MERSSRLIFLRLGLVGTILMGALTLNHLAVSARTAGTLYTSPKWWVVLGLGGLVLLVEIILLGASGSSFQATIFLRAQAGLRALSRLGKLNLALFGLSVAAYAFILLGPFGYLFETVIYRIFLFTWVILAGGVFLRAAGVTYGWGTLFGGAAVLAAAGYQAASFLPDISSSPLSHYWSEASRFYYASLYFSEQIYGLQVLPTVLHPSRYLLQAVPFLIPDSPLWLHRLWQALLWIGMTLLSATIFARRLGVKPAFRYWVAAAWAFIFLLAGPVYYHLQVPFLIVVWAFGERERNFQRQFWKPLVVVILASAWAGISRVNWFPVPAMLALTFYLLFEPVGSTPLWKYLLKPALWTVAGIGTALGAQTLYALLSGNPSEQFTSSFSSDLLWYRLFPNPTYPPGILLASLLFSAPLLLMIWLRLRGNWRRYHPIRLLGLGSMLLALLAGGLVVSIKIGGGSNLHNIDAYLALLMVLAAYLYFALFTVEPDQEDKLQPASQLWLNTALVASLLLPVYFTLQTGGPQALPTQEQIDRALKTINSYIGELEPQDEVLFIAERQLVTFHYVDVKLVPDYERVFLMEMVMAGNADYLERFHSDLRNGRFKMIVSEPLFYQRKGQEESFGEENDAWVRLVSKYVLCYYRPRNALADLHIQLLFKRDGVRDCQ